MPRQLLIKILNKEFPFTLKDTPAANELKSQLPFKVDMTKLNDNEIYYKFDNSFTTNIKSVGTINSGDIYLYQSDYLVLFYKTFTTLYSYTEIGSLTSTDGLEDAIGSTSIVSVEWGIKSSTTPTTTTPTTTTPTTTTPNTTTPNTTTPTTTTPTTTTPTTTTPTTTTPTTTTPTTTTPTTTTPTTTTITTTTPTTTTPITTTPTTTTPTTTTPTTTTPTTTTPTTTTLTNTTLTTTTTTPTTTNISNSSQTHGSNDEYFDIFKKSNFQLQFLFET